MRRLDAAGPESTRCNTALRVSLACTVVLCWAATASAQLDPLLFLKRVPPTVIVVVDTSVRMLEDGAGISSEGIAQARDENPGTKWRQVPAAVVGPDFEDRLTITALQDAKNEAIAAMNADTAANRSCRNTVVVLITGGRNDGSAAYTSENEPATFASSFRSVGASGVTKRVPIFVVGVKPPVSDEVQLQAIADNSGGSYRRATSAADVTAAINYAVQAGFARAADFDAGRSSEFVPVSPVVGTVNLKNARSASGSTLPNTEIAGPAGGQALPQRSNVLITAGFGLPGFDGRIRAFRTYKPVADATKPTGWKFVNDGTPLWPDLDGRSQYVGLARTPASPDARNIYTYVPNGNGGGSVVPFTAARAAELAPHLRVGDANALIDYVRAQPLGAVIGSTPALMDPPSLDPAPDDEYGRADVSSTFAGKYKDRRSIIFFGANDGMIHAVDARTGYEIWAFIPYNLLPKLRTLLDGQPVEQFDYFVDSSPKIAEVKINGQWRSLLLIGQASGGTFYQAFDVTEAGMGVDPASGDLTAVNALLARFDSPDESIVFKWAFPSYSSFDPTYTDTLPVSDGTPGGKVKLFGDLKASATFAEKTVGFTWSDPAVGPLDANRSVNAVIVGSGYFPNIEGFIPGRGPGAPKAGNVLYLIDANTGALIGNPGGTACSGSGCLSVGDVAGDGRKNALQADPSASGVSGSTVVTRAYMGDVDGRYWRFNFTAAGAITSSLMLSTNAPIYASSALLFIGTTETYMFFATGSDLLPVTTTGGTGVFRLYGLKDNAPGAGATVRFARELATVTNANGFASGERPSTSPSVAGDIVFYTTIVESASAPCADVSSRLYGLTYVGGAAYDADGDGKVASNETPIVQTVQGRATAPFIVDQHLYFGATRNSGAMVEVFGDPEDFNNGIGQVGVRILSWREIR